MGIIIVFVVSAFIMYCIAWRINSVFNFIQNICDDANNIMRTCSVETMKKYTTDELTDDIMEAYHNTMYLQWISFHELTNNAYKMIFSIKPLKRKYWLTRAQMDFLAIKNTIFYNNN